MNFTIHADIRRPGGFTLHVEEECQADALGIAGPSGSGKSTLLDAIAGIEPGARVFLDGEDLSKLSLPDRRVGYMTQDSLLFPHLSVERNLLYSPRARGFADVIDALSLSHLLARMPGRLSGGEKRRVALGRAIISRPRVLLLDEPFAGLDDTLRREAMSLLDHVKKRFRLPMILVSHNADEIIGLTDWTIRLEAGRVVARGPGESILNHRETRIDNYFSGEALGPGRVNVEGVEMSVALPEHASGSVRLACYAHDILVATTRPVDISARNVIETKIVSLTPAGGLGLLSIEKPSLRVLVTMEAVQTLGLQPGASVFAIVKASSIAYLGSSGGRL